MGKSTRNPVMTADLGDEFSIGISRKRDSAVGIATGYELEGREIVVRVPVRARFFPLHIIQTDSEVQPASYTRVPATHSPVVKRPKREAGHSPPTSAEVKNTWIYTSSPPYVFMA
jgi:hypothetical protein